MKNVIDWLVKFWWALPVTGICSIILLYLSLDWDVSGFGVIIPIILSGVAVLSGLLQIVIFIVSLKRGDWKTFTGTTVTGCINLPITFGGVLLIISTGLMMLPDDYDFGKMHPIPDDMVFEIPHDRSYFIEENEVDSTNQQMWLQIWNGLQGGKYEYDFYYPQLPDGLVFLRCYEATENIALSSIERCSSAEVQGHTSFGKVVEEKDFTIYEGDWGSYNAVRVEVWHRNKSTGQEQLLLQKIYRMEGWER